MGKYCVGDLVRIDYQGVRGEGVIYQVESDGDYVVEVLSGENLYFLHNCNGLFDSNRGWYVADRGITALLGSTFGEKQVDVDPLALMEVLNGT